MPPVKKRIVFKGKKETDASLARRRRARRPVRNYNKQSSNYQRKALNMLQIKTLVPKELTVGIQYKTTITINTMGFGPALNTSGTATILRIALNAPTKGVNGSIVDLLSLGGGFTAPVFTRSNPDLTLAPKLNNFFEQYGKGIVTSSNAKVRVVPRPNQKLGQSFVNAPAAGSTGENYPYAANHMPYLSVVESEIDGQSYVWSLKTKQTGLLQDGVSGPTPSYHEMQNDIPGMKMSQLKSYANGTSSAPVMSTGGFTPKFFGIKDWRDNLSKLKFAKSGTTDPAEILRSYFYVGVCNRHPAFQTSKPQNVDFEVTVNYNCRFLQRKGDVQGGDDPIPEPVHSAEL
ncbi:MAG: putative capsid protein [Cressdnaviricota sp.]|nr:MAG: putative capsid protein [Cressdnaviricota sp.]